MGVGLHRYLKRRWQRPPCVPRADVTWHQADANGGPCPLGVLTNANSTRFCAKFAMTRTLKECMSGIFLQLHPRIEHEFELSNMQTNMHEPNTSLRWSCPEKSQSDGIL